MNIKKQQILTFLKYLLITFFALLICFESYQAIAHYSLNITSQKRITTLLILIVVILFKNKVTWLLAMLLFLCGLYYIIAGQKYSQNSALDFTSPFHDLFRTQLNDGLNIFLQAFSIYFYLLSFLIFSTYPVRRWYKISAKKAPKIKPYL